MELRSALKNAIKEDNLVIFCGSGLSKRFDLPDWKQLVIDVIKEIDDTSLNPYLSLLENQGSGMSPAEVLEKLKSHHNTIRKYIRNNFNITEGDFSFHKKILELSGKIITTNFDNAFEMASDNKTPPTCHTSDFNISEINKHNEPYIFKLHGSVSECDHCILFKEDYELLYRNEHSATQKLKTIFSEKVILFIGFSFNDPDINLIFKNIDKLFSNNNKHFFVSPSADKNNFDFIETISVKSNEEIGVFIDKCLDYKKLHLIPDNTPLLKENITTYTTKQSLVILSPNPLDIEFNDDIDKVKSLFSSLDTKIYTGTLNLKTLSIIDDYDLLIVISKVFKSKVYIEGDNLKSELVSADEICANIPNEKIPIIFITNEEIQLIENYPVINIKSFKPAIINKFIFKAIRNMELLFKEDEISVFTDKLLDKPIEKGETEFYSIYGNDKVLEIGKKSLLNVIGRIEEQSSIAIKLISIIKSNKLLNIKASGGTGKTTLIKKISYELYIRGYYKSGVSFRSCENVKTFSDFEELVTEGFNLVNILNFQEYLTINFSSSKIDLLIILDNFETVINTLTKSDLQKAYDLLKFATDFCNIAITSRERISSIEDFEDVYSLNQLITDDAFVLFEENYGKITNTSEIRMLREDILENLLNNNPLAINLVTKSRTRFKFLIELKDQLREHFFESINEDYSIVFKNNADLNVERTKSIYQSINYSYSTLNVKEKIAFELLSLFPDGISISNFKKCFEKSNSTNSISDKEFRILRNKSLVEDYNGILQLQPLIRRFAEYQFNKRPEETQNNFCKDAYSFNCFILEILDHFEKKRSSSDALRLFAVHKNNLSNVLTYITNVKDTPKKYFINYLNSLDRYVTNEKQVEEFNYRISLLRIFFSDLPNANIFIDVLKYNKTYYYEEFDESYRKLSEFLSVEEMAQRNYSEEDFVENLYKGVIANIHGMEGFTIERISSEVKNQNFNCYLSFHLFYIGVIDNISRERQGFYFFEYQLMLNELNISDLETYISRLHQEEHLEKMQTTYTLSKVKKIDIKVIQKLVVTNPYTKGLKELMLAFNTEKVEDKIAFFESALINLSHIKYYYLEALYYYCKLLKEVNRTEFLKKLEIGRLLSKSIYYQYMEFLFEELHENKGNKYKFSYDYYPIENLEDYVLRHNKEWKQIFKNE